MTVKRFVAGAVCPRCAVMDRLRIWRDTEREYRECVDCGYQDAMRLDGASEPQELTTRVNQPSSATAAVSDPPAKASGDEQVIQFVPNPAAKKT